MHKPELSFQFEAPFGMPYPVGAFGGAPTYQTVESRGQDILVVIPPRVTVVMDDDAEHILTQRDGHIVFLAARGRLVWQETGYGRRSLAENAMGRLKAIIGPRLRARCLAGQRTEAAIGVAVLNRMLEAGRLKSVRNMEKFV